MKKPANRLQKQVASRFRAGQSGNPNGRKAGTRNRATVIAERLMEADAEAVVDAVLAAARGGDMVAARLVLDRIAPPRRGRPVEFALPPIRGSADLVAALGTVLAAVAAGTLTPDEGNSVAGLIDIKRRAIETAEIDARLTALETAAERRNERQASNQTARDPPRPNRPSHLGRRHRPHHQTPT